MYNLFFRRKKLIFFSNFFSTTFYLPNNMSYFKPSYHYLVSISKFAKDNYSEFFRKNDIDTWNLYNFLVYRANQEDFTTNTQVEHNHYTNFLEKFKVENNEEVDHLIKNFKVYRYIFLLYKII